MVTLRVLGIDLAWGVGTDTDLANETGLVAADGDGRIVDAGWARGVDEVRSLSWPLTPTVGSQTPPGPVGWTKWSPGWGPRPSRTPWQWSSHIRSPPSPAGDRPNRAPLTGRMNWTRVEQERRMAHPDETLKLERPPSGHKPARPRKKTRNLIGRHSSGIEEFVASRRQKTSSASGSRRTGGSGKQSSSGSSRQHWKGNPPEAPPRPSLVGMSARAVRDRVRGAVTNPSPVPSGIGRSEQVSVRSEVSGSRLTVGALRRSCGRRSVWPHPVGRADSLSGRSAL